MSETAKILYKISKDYINNQEHNIMTAKTIRSVIMSVINDDIIKRNTEMAYLTGIKDIRFEYSIDTEVLINKLNGFIEDYEEYERYKRSEQEYIVTGCCNII